MNFFFVLLLGWSPNPIDQEIIHYTVTVDDFSQIEVPASQCLPNLCSVKLTISNGAHSFSVTASNLTGTSEPTTVYYSNGELHRNKHNGK